MSSLIKRTVGAGTLGALFAALAVAPSADAATYYACVKKKSGAFRIVSRRTKCRRNEQKISFNSTGISGRNGANGRNGNNGKNGANGTNGTNGTTGFTSTLPKGATEEGTWAVVVPAVETVAFAAISFNIPLAAPPTANLVAQGGTSTAACPGKVAAPAAASGHLCVYTSTSENTTLLIDDPSFEGGIENSASPWGTTVRASTGATAPGLAYGTWAVTG
jgi:hypothetical protein